MSTFRHTKKSYARALKYGYRSGLERQIGDHLKARGISFGFETLVIPFVQPETNRKYTPDFILDNGIIIESKGMFDSADRKKMLLVKAQYPKLDIRFVFSNARAKIYKGSKTTHARWASKYGFPWAHRKIPDEWLKESRKEIIL